MSPTSYAMTLREFRLLTEGLDENTLIMGEGASGYEDDVYYIARAPDGESILIKEHPSVNKPVILLQLCSYANY